MGYNQVQRVPTLEQKKNANFSPRGGYIHLNLLKNENMLKLMLAFSCSSNHITENIYQISLKLLCFSTLHMHMNFHLVTSQYTGVILYCTKYNLNYQNETQIW